MDLEMTGLEPETDVIVEIATLITDDDLNIIAEGPDLVIHQSDEVLARMNQIIERLWPHETILEPRQGAEVGDGVSALRAAGLGCGQCRDDGQRRQP